MSTTRDHRGRPAMPPAAVRDPAQWQCERCRTSIPGLRFKDLWNLGWRPAEVVGPPTRRPPLVCPDCLHRRT